MLGVAIDREEPVVAMLQCSTRRHFLDPASAAILGPEFLCREIKHDTLPVPRRGPPRSDSQLSANPIASGFVERTIVDALKSAGLLR
jgi:hypothetical protein